MYWLRIASDYPNNIGLNTSTLTYLEVLFLNVNQLKLTRGIFYIKINGE